MNQEQAKQGEHPEGILRFSETAYITIRDIVFEERLRALRELFVTSTISFRAWMNPASFLYFCLTTSRCPSCTRIFLGEKPIESIRESDEAPYASCIFQAHEIFGHKAHFLTYNKVADAFEKCKEYEKLLSKEQIDWFMTDNKRLDFGLLEFSSNKVLLLPVWPPENEKEVNICIVVNNSTLKKQYDYKASDLVFNEPVQIGFKPEMVSMYDSLKKLLNLCVPKDPKYRIRSSDLL